MIEGEANLIGITELTLIILIVVLLFVLAPFPALKRTIGICMVIIGVIMCFIPLIGILIGIPIIFVGALFLLIGRGTETTVTSSALPPTIEQKGTIQCPNCKKLNQESATYCSNCGRKLTR
jgi:hypothetical protein